MKFLLIVTGFNCQSYAKDCFDSIIAQSFKDYKAIFINDGSTDKTNMVLNNVQHLNKKIQVVHYEQNLGACFRRYEAIRNSFADKQTIIVLIGMDDKLFPNALEIINVKYENENVWMTYGNWVNQFGQGLPADFQLDFDEVIHSNRTYRKVKYRATAPNTFKKFLFDEIPPSDFLFERQWIKSTTESEVMFSCLEMSGKNRIGLIKEPIYIYTQERKDNARRRFGNNYQARVYNAIINRPKKQLYDERKLA